MNLGLPDINAVSRCIMDAFPAPVFIADGDRRIADMNRVAAEFLGRDRDALGEQLCGEVIRCARTVGGGTGCGLSPLCAECPIRQSVETVMQEGTGVVRRWCPMDLVVKDRPRHFCFLVSVTPFKLSDVSRLLIVLEDVTEIAELRRLLPVCSHCGKVCSDKQYWQSVEEYLRTHTSVVFSHGLCPACLAELYGDEGRLTAEEVDAAYGRHQSSGSTSPA